MTLDFLYPLVLMSRSEKIENDFHRVECCKRNFHEEGVPVAHCAVPEAWKLESLELAALVALRADESGILIHILEEVETFSLVVVEAAYDVYRIKVGSRSQCVACVVI